MSPIEKLPLADDCDSNSRDSGYSESGHKRDGFCVPRSCAPTRRLNLDLSPKVSSPFKSPSEGRRLAREFASLKKKSEEDEFMKLICEEETAISGGENCPSSDAFSSLLSAPIQSSQQSGTTTTPQVPRLPIRRCLSMVDSSTPLSFKVSWETKLLLAKIDHFVSFNSVYTQSFFVYL